MGSLGYQVHKTRESKGEGLTHAEINLGSFYVTDVETGCVLATHFNTREEAKAWVLEETQKDLVNE